MPSRSCITHAFNHSWIGLPGITKLDNYSCCRLSPGVLTRSLTMARPGTTLLPSTCSCTTPLKPSQRSVKQSNTTAIAGRPGPIMGMLLHRLAMACLLPELCKRQVPAFQLSCQCASNIVANACCWSCAGDKQLPCDGLLLPFKFALSCQPAAAARQGPSTCHLIALPLCFACGSCPAVRTTQCWSHNDSHLTTSSQDG